MAELLNLPELEASTYISGVGTNRMLSNNLKPVPASRLNDFIGDEINTYLAVKRMYPAEGLMVNGNIAVNFQSGAFSSITINRFRNIGSIFVRIGSELYLSGTVTALSSGGSSAFLLNNLPAAIVNQNTDFFVYMGLKTSDGSVFATVSRFPGARFIGDFSTTNTNGRYSVLNAGSSGHAVTDPVTVVGRVTLQWNGTALVNPTDFSTRGYNIINFPVRESEWRTWTPTFTGGPLSYLTVNVVAANYRLSHRTALVHLRTSGTTSGTGNYVPISLPFDAIRTSDSFNIIFKDGGTFQNGVADINPATTLNPNRNDAANFGVGAGREFKGYFVYET